MVLEPYSTNCNTSRYYQKTGKRVVSTTLDEQEAIRIQVIAKAMKISVAELIKRSLKQIDLSAELVTVGSGKGQTEIA
jgi:hypothetical protein